MYKLHPNCVSEIPEAILLVKHLTESYYAKFEFSVNQIWVKISIFLESGGVKKPSKGVSHHLMTPHDDLDPLGCDFIKTLKLQDRVVRGKTPRYSNLRERGKEQIIGTWNSWVFCVGEF